MGWTRLLVGLGALGLAINANATLVTGNLQSGLDALTVATTANPSGSFLDVNDDQHQPDEVWMISASSMSASVLLFEFASFENSNRFGIYDIYDPSNTLELFSGSACGTADVTCSGNDNEVTLNYDPSTSTYRVFNWTTLTLTSATFSGERFGYYLDSSASAGGGFFYSESNRNMDVADAAHNGTTDHMVAYAGDGSLWLDVDGGGAGGAAMFGPGEFILAWEDLLFPASDYDYSDMVVLVESVTPLSEPGVLALLSIGLIGVGALQRRSKH